MMRHTYRACPFLGQDNMFHLKTPRSLHRPDCLQARAVVLLVPSRIISATGSRQLATGSHAVQKGLIARFSTARCQILFVCWLKEKFEIHFDNNHTITLVWFVKMNIQTENIIGGKMFLDWLANDLKLSLKNIPKLIMLQSFKLEVKAKWSRE